MNPIPIVCTFSIFLLTIILSYKCFAEELDILKSFSVTIIDIIVEDMRKRTELTEAVPSLHLHKGKRKHNSCFGPYFEKTTKEPFSSN